VARLSADPDGASEIVSVIGLIRRIERVADHAKNMAVMIPYVTEGRLLRHQGAAANGADDGE
jgi:phosphate uptake regulator